MLISRVLSYAAGLIRGTLRLSRQGFLKHHEECGRWRRLGMDRSKLLENGIGSLLEFLREWASSFFRRCRSVQITGDVLCFEDHGRCIVFLKVDGLFYSSVPCWKRF